MRFPFLRMSESAVAAERIGHPCPAGVLLGEGPAGGHRPLPGSCRRELHGSGQVWGPTLARRCAARRAQKDGGTHGMASHPPTPTPIPTRTHAGQAAPSAPWTSAGGPPGCAGSPSPGAEVRPACPHPHPGAFWGGSMGSGRAEDKSRADPPPPRLSCRCVEFEGGRGVRGEDNGGMNMHHAAMARGEQTRDPRDVRGGCSSPVHVHAPMRKGRPSLPFPLLIPQAPGCPQAVVIGRSMQCSAVPPPTHPPPTHARGEQTTHPPTHPCPLRRCCLRGAWPRPATAASSTRPSSAPSPTPSCSA